MCTVLGVLGTLFLFKLVVRRLRWRHALGGCGGRAWHHRWHRRFPPWMRDRGPIDLGNLDDLDDLAIRKATPRLDVERRVDEVLRGLELNARQAAEAGDVISILRAAIGPERYRGASEVLLALRAAGKTPFDVDLAEAALGPRLRGDAGREARDALEHLHNVLTEEQRAALLAALSKPHFNT